MTDFIEQNIITAIKRLLTGRVNEILGEAQFTAPVIEFGSHSGMTTIYPVISLSTCERTEKERLIKQEAYTLTITFEIQETQDSHLLCYAFSAAISKALSDDPTLGGVADRATVSGKKYNPPKVKNCGQSWELVIAIRVTVEGV
jgi:hypothetical protein